MLRSISPRTLRGVQKFRAATRLVIEGKAFPTVEESPGGSKG
jgi:hypothetical protein